MRGHSGEVCGLRWSSNGKLLASGGDDNLIHIWEGMNMESSKYLHRLGEHRSAIKALAWCPYQSHILASGGGKNDGRIKMWDAKTGLCLSSLDTKAQVFFTPDKRYYHVSKSTLKYKCVMLDVLYSMTTDCLRHITIFDVPMIVPLRFSF